MEPDLAGFAEAQRRHRQATGQPVTFLMTPVVTFPPGTAIDPGTGEPYDASIEPLSSDQASASATCSVAHRPMLGSPDVAGEAGLGERNHVMLIADPDTFDLASGAIAFMLRGHEYKITALRGDAPVAGGDRLLVFGRGKGKGETL